MLKSRTKQALIHTNAPPEALGFLRIWIFSIWFLIIVYDPVQLLSYLPLPIFTPIGLLKLIPKTVWETILNKDFLFGFKIFTILSLSCAIIGIFTRPAVIIACILLIFHQSIIRGFGFIQHAELPLLYAAIILAIFPCGDGLAFQKPQKIQNRPYIYGIALFTIMAVICFAYHAIGVYRTVTGGVELFTGNSMKYWVIERTFRNQFYDFEFGKFLFNYPILSALIKYGFPLSTLIEILAPLCLISRRFRFFFSIYMPAFHIMNFIFMKIFFWELCLLYIVFFDIGRWFSVQIPEGKRPLVFFDGECGLCDRFVKMVMDRDKYNIFRFAPLQGKTAQKYTIELPKDPSHWSIVLVDEEGTHYQSQAVLRIISRLGPIWRIILVLQWIPRSIRDRIYELIAMHRYQWFGKRQTCRIPTRVEREKMLP